jgi:hypothetical protein
MDNEFARKLFGGRSPAPENLEFYRRQLSAFRSKFGREMGPDDPFFFDPHADSPRFRPPEDAGVALDCIAEMMTEAGVDAAAVYAFRRTRGLFPGSGAAFTEDETAEWNAAIDEYYSRRARGAGQ